MNTTAQKNASSAAAETKFGEWKIQINESAPVKCSRSIMIDADLGKVWSVLTDINSWDQWQADITGPKLIGEPTPGASFKWKTGGVGIQSTLHTVEPNVAFGWTGRTFGMYAIHNWRLVNEGGRTRVIVVESMEGFLSSVFRKTFNKNLEAGMTRWLELLKMECEKK